MGFERVLITQGSPSTSHGRWSWSRKSLPGAQSKHKRMSPACGCPAKNCPVLLHTQLRGKCRSWYSQAGKIQWNTAECWGNHEIFLTRALFLRENWEKFTAILHGEGKARTREGKEWFQGYSHWRDGCWTPSGGMRNRLQGTTGLMDILKRSRVKNKHQKIPLVNKQQQMGFHLPNLESQTKNQTFSFSQKPKGENMCVGNHTINTNHFVTLFSSFTGKLLQSDEI